MRCRGALSRCEKRPSYSLSVYCLAAMSSLRNRSRMWCSLSPTIFGRVSSVAMATRCALRPTLIVWPHAASYSSERTAKALCVAHLRTDRWSYMRYTDGTEELYDMQADPNQYTNLAKYSAQLETLSQLRQRLEQWMDQTKGNSMKKLKQKK